MEQYIGLDVSPKDTSISIRQDGKRIWRGKCPSDPKRLAEVIRKRAPQAKRVVFETGPLSVWFYHALTAEGVPAICIDARHAKAHLDMNPNKTDANDADGLRQRMQHDMMMQGLKPHTQKDYIRHVRRLGAFLRRPPNTASEEALRRFQIYQHEARASLPTINGTVSAQRLFYSVTLWRQDLARGLVAMRRPYKAPEVPSIEEEARLLEAAPGIKYKGTTSCSPAPLLLQHQ